MKVYFDTIGCRLNQSEIEKLARQFRADGHLISPSAAEADLVVINTCTVTGAAASDSRQKIRQAARAGQARIAVTGCWATLEPDRAGELPQVDWVVPNLDKKNLAAIVLDKSLESFDIEPIARRPLPGMHLRTRAFIKVQDGCDNHCTFCVTRLARGRGRSETVASVLAEVRAAQIGGAKEIVLSGVHLGSWGKDFPAGLHLRDLIKAILEETDIERIRLSSLEPWDLDEGFFRLWENPRMCRHLHMPLQSGSAETLKRMVRNTTPRDFASLIEAARSSSPGMAITTDIIVGFPGENEREFDASLEFVQQMKFAGGHVFPYSPREGTAATRIKPQVPVKTARARSQRMRAVLEESSRAYRRRFLGREAAVLWEATDRNDSQGWRLHGLTDTFIRVEAVSSVPLWNQISPVFLSDICESGMIGTIKGTSH